MPGRAKTYAVSPTTAPALNRLRLHSVETADEFLLNVCLDPFGNPAPVGKSAKRPGSVQATAVRHQSSPRPLSSS